MDILPVLLYLAKTYVLSQNNKSALGVFEKRILRKIFGPVRVGEEYHIRMNHGLYNLYDAIAVVQCIKMQ